MPWACEVLQQLVFPHLASVLVERVAVEDGVLRIDAVTMDGGAACPGCGALSARVHSRYERRIADAPVGGQPVPIALSVPRLFCAAPACQRDTFAKQIEGLTRRCGRRTPLSQRVVGALGVVPAARAVGRLALLLGITVSRMTVLRTVMALPEPVRTVPRVLGVDEFATGKGRRYGTILLDCEPRQPIDLLPGREAETLAAWLRAHAGVEIICRDRAAFFADRARSGAPDAQHCADKWHLTNGIYGTTWPKLLNASSPITGPSCVTWSNPTRHRIRNLGLIRSRPGRRRPPRIRRASSATGSATPTPPSRPTSSRG
jgi:transposase